MEATNMRSCQRCGVPYDWRRSPSGFLKMTYCGSLCEKADLGFTIETLLHSQAPVRGHEPAPWEPLLAA